MIKLDARKLDRQITFQRKVAAKGFASAGRDEWVTVAENVWASVQDVLPSRAESVTEGLTMAKRPARIRIRHRGDITSDMRILFGERVMEIVAGPVELGRRDGLEMVAEDYSTAGGT